MKGLEVLLAGFMAGCVAHNPVKSKPSYKGDDADSRQAFTRALETVKQNTRELIGGGDDLPQLAYIAIVQSAEAFNNADMLTCDEGREKYDEVEHELNFLRLANQDLTDDYLKDARNFIIDSFGEDIEKGPLGCTAEAGNKEEAKLAMARLRAHRAQDIYIPLVTYHRSLHGWRAIDRSQLFENLPEHENYVRSYVHSQFGLINLRKKQFNDASCVTRANAMEEVWAKAQVLKDLVGDSSAVSSERQEEITEYSNLKVVHCTF